MKKKLPYSVPEGYFETMEGRVMDNILRHSRPFRRFAPALAIAASVIILLGVGFFFVNKPAVPSSQTALTEDEIIEYLIDSRAPLAYFDETL